MPLHAASAIVLSMCMFVVGFGLGYVRGRKDRKVITRTIHVPHPEKSDAPYQG